jgi:hypothetical protein
LERARATRLLLTTLPGLLLVFVGDLDAYMAH